MINFFILFDSFNKRENMMKIIKSSLNNIKDYVHDYRKVRYTKKVCIIQYFRLYNFMNKENMIKLFQV